MYDRSIVYGSFNDFEITLLPVQTAKYYGSLHTAHKDGITFAELYEQLIEFFNLIMEHRCYYLYGFYPPSYEGMSCKEYYIYLFRQLYDEFGNGSGWIGSVEIDHEFGSLIDFTNFYQREIKH